MEDRAMYAGVSYIPDADWLAYAGTLDSDSAFLGGTAALEYDSVDNDFYNQSMFSMHKVYAGGVSRVIPRSDWEYGNKYNAHPLITKSYVIVKEYVSGFSVLNVYRCLFSPNQPSYVAPSGSSQSAIQMSDGYIWKYMYTIGNSAALRFLNTDWMPVPEKIPASEYSSITIDSSNYDQYVTQTTTTPGMVYSMNIDSDLLIQHIDSDAAFSAAFDYSSVNVVARDVGGRTPTKEMTATLYYDSESSSFYGRITQIGEGYLGPVSFGTSTTSSSIGGLTTTTSPGEGFGANIPKELKAQSVMVSARTVPDETNVVFYGNSQYNLLSLHSGPIDSITSKTAQNEFYVACQSFTTTSTAGFEAGDVIATTVDMSKTYNVVGVYGSRVYYTSSRPGSSSESLTAGIEVRTLDNAKITNVDTAYDREIALNSSEPIVVEKLVAPITRLDGQIEAFNFVLNF